MDHKTIYNITVIYDTYVFLLWLLFYSLCTIVQVVFKVLPPHLKVDNPYAQEVQDLLKLTNLRVIFKELHTLGELSEFDKIP